MKNLRFKQLLLLSDSQKSANQFKFEKRFNLITASDNSVGKSTLAKLLFWSLGCEPELDSTWKNTDCKTLLQFTVGDNKYSVMRYGNIIHFKENNAPTVKYTSIGGDYSRKLAEIVNFKVLLPSRGDESELMIPPPVYYFLPFYIDQKRGWSKAWESFDKLGQFKNWKRTVIKYHIGYLSPKHFDLEQEIYERKKRINQLNEDIQKIGYALEVVSNHVPNVEITIKEEEFQAMTLEIQNELSQLSQKQEAFLDELSALTSDRTYLEHQKSIAEHLIKELDEDYIFSAENIEADEIECPLCGTMHENSLVNRASILADKQQAENQLQAINKKLLSVSKKISKTEQDSSEIKTKINQINEKYSVTESKQRIPLHSIIESFAYKSINRNINNTKKEKLSAIDSAKNEEKELKKEQSSLLTKEDKKKIDESFMNLLTTYIKLLDAEGINLSAIKTPLDYNKIIKEGGAAENTRGVLAYYLSVFSLIDLHGNEIQAPLVIDTPNQQEQSGKNYENIVKLITTKIPKQEQVIICAMENEKLQPYKAQANVITLDRNKLLHTDKYDRVKKAFMAIEATVSDE
jgi:predicted  nucleic acid-binding Zn-ribbon protein